MKHLPATSLSSQRHLFRKYEVEQSEEALRNVNNLVTIFKIEVRTTLSAKNT